ncbi:Na+/H+ antiporter subunit [Symbiobacterium thermophilum IAM 14863]|uniref:Na+/H+ antiporter subunit n=1 Tax=Symbiobacterium thermophilum (strain DSM 24528 / JCM 14929 / IAM 14863 / T) TaxID=292459 RepID=Q67NU7_SYMTH|nr:Na+/H+ antiporter subunit [Symbiobacterium thermophilum IAM 14863]
MATEILIGLLVLLGTAAAVLGTLGLVRMPDVYNRLHAVTMAITFATVMMVLAGTLYFSTTHGLTLKLLLVIPFVFWTSSAGSFVIARGAHRTGVRPAPLTIRDDLQEDIGIDQEQE